MKSICLLGPFWDSKFLRFFLATAFLFSHGTVVTSSFFVNSNLFSSWGDWLNFGISLKKFSFQSSPQALLQNPVSEINITTQVKQRLYDKNDKAVQDPYNPGYQNIIFYWNYGDKYNQQRHETFTVELILQNLDCETIVSEKKMYKSINMDVISNVLKCVLIY